MNDMPPVIEVFYASSCAPCRIELPTLAAFAHQHPNQMRIVILDEPDKARRELEAAAPDLPAIAVNSIGDQRAVLRDAGDADGILPYSLVQRGDGAVCRSWRGMLSLERIRKLLGQC